MIDASRYAADLEECEQAVVRLTAQIEELTKSREAYEKMRDALQEICKLWNSTQLVMPLSDRDDHKVSDVQTIENILLRNGPLHVSDIVREGQQLGLSVKGNGKRAPAVVVRDKMVHSKRFINLGSNVWALAEQKGKTGMTGQVCQISGLYTSHCEHATHNHYTKGDPFGTCPTGDHLVLWEWQGDLKKEEQPEGVDTFSGSSWVGVSGKTYAYNIYDITSTSWNEVAGNYIFAKKAKSGGWTPVCIGETENIRDGIARQLVSPCVHFHGATHIHAHSNGDTASRAFEKEDLAVRYKPDCNPV